MSELENALISIVGAIIIGRVLKFILPQEKILRIIRGDWRRIIRGDWTVWTDDERLARSRQELSVLEDQLARRILEERDLQDRINKLKGVRLEAAEMFAREVSKLTAAGERRSAWRDYILFGLGAVVSTAISVVLDWLK